MNYVNYSQSQFEPICSGINTYEFFCHHSGHKYIQLNGNLFSFFIKLLRKQKPYNEKEQDCILLYDYDIKYCYINEGISNINYINRILNQKQKLNKQYFGVIYNFKNRNGIISGLDGFFNSEKKEIFIACLARFIFEQLKREGFETFFMILHKREIYKNEICPPHIHVVCYKKEG